MKKLKVASQEEKNVKEVVKSSPFEDAMWAVFGLCMLTKTVLKFVSCPAGPILQLVLIGVAALALIMRDICLPLIVKKNKKSQPAKG